MSLRTRLSRPLWLTDGRCLRTIGEGLDIVLALPVDEVAERRWQQVLAQLKAALFSGRDDDAAAATAELERALSSPPFGDARLVVYEKKPPAPSIRRPKRQPARKARPRRAGTRAAS